MPAWDGIKNYIGGDPTFAGDVTINGTLAATGEITLTGGGGLPDSAALTFGTGDDAALTHDGTTGLDLTVADNDAGAFRIAQGANEYLAIDTTNNAETVRIGQDMQRASTARDLSYQLRLDKMDDLWGQPATEAEGQWTLNSGVDAQALDPAPDTAQAQGVWALVTGNADGTVANDGSQMVWSGVPLRLDSLGGNAYIEARIRIKSAVTDVSVNFGLTDATGLEEPFTIGGGDAITSVATDAVCFVYDTGADTDQWFGCAVDSDTDDTGNGTTGTAPTADTWQILGIEVSNDGATIEFYINGTSVHSLSGAAGVGADVVLYPTVVACSTTTTSKTVDVDWVRVEAVR